MLPSGKPYFPDARRIRFPSYETRSSGYQPHTVCRSSASSLQNLTGKRSLTYSIAPFIVELFTVERLTRSPRWSDPGAACRQTTAPHASRVERTHPKVSPDPADGIFTRFVRRFYNGEAANGHFTDTASTPEGFEVFPHRPTSHFWLVPRGYKHGCYWIERWDYFDYEGQLPYEGSRPKPSLLQRASIALSERVSTYSALRASTSSTTKGSWQLPVLIRG